MFSSSPRYMAPEVVMAESSNASSPKVRTGNMFSQLASKDILLCIHKTKEILWCLVDLSFMTLPCHLFKPELIISSLPYVSGSRKRDLMAQKFFFELLIQSSSTIFEL